MRGPGELGFRHEYVVTNLAESVPAEWVFQTYQQRGTMENYIKEEKHGFFLDKTDSSGFRENQARRIGRAKGVETYFAFNPFC
uniref:transposase n=1 Tax=Aerococcus urinaeequi TaxID=51665 RepID=UPI00352B8C7D